MSTTRESICFNSLGERIAGVLFHPQVAQPVPAFIICHGAGEFKENHFELAESLANQGIAALVIDMHGHGESDGERYCVLMQKWMADVQAAISFLVTHPRIDRERIGAFGISSGGTAILEVAAIDDRLKVLVTLGATVRNSLPRPTAWLFQSLFFIGGIKKWLTQQQWRLSLLRLGNLQLVSDAEINRQLTTNPKATAAYREFPFPGGSQAFFVDTIQRVANIHAPTLVLWGADDKLDPPETGHLLHETLKCKKALHIIPGNGHAGHLDRHKDKVFTLTTDWVLQNLTQPLASSTVAGGLQHGNENNRSGSSPELRGERKVGVAFSVS